MPVPRANAGALVLGLKMSTGFRRFDGRRAIASEVVDATANRRRFTHYYAVARAGRHVSRGISRRRLHDYVIEVDDMLRRAATYA